jgi:hypothetical protein
MTNSQHVCEVWPRKHHRGFDLISDALPFFFSELRSAVFRRTRWNGSTSVLSNKQTGVQSPRSAILAVNLANSIHHFGVEAERLNRLYAKYLSVAEW